MIAFLDCHQGVFFVCFSPGLWSVFWILSEIGLCEFHYVGVPQGGWSVSFGDDAGHFC